jgi:ribonucleoside-diphosphate reductase alpha chain
VEIGLHPVINWGLTEKEQDLINKEKDRPHTGWQVCNLSTINGAKCTTPAEFYRACINATVIGTLQAAYSDIPFLGESTKLIIEKDALLGVSICGFMDSPKVLFNPEVLRVGAKICQITNEYLAKEIGINPAARITCVKPEGTASLVLGAASGIHPHHAKYYFRRVQANRVEPVFQFFKKINPHMTESSVYNPNRDDVIHFPIMAPKDAILRNDVNALQFLKLVKLVQLNWVIPGTRENNRSPGLYHNVSNTCTVKSTEWDEVEKYIWENREYFTGISLLSDMGDKTYQQAPREEITTTEDINRWNSLLYNEVDYTQLREDKDNTSLKETVACAGGACEIVST